MKKSIAYCSSSVFYGPRDNDNIDRPINFFHDRRDSKLLKICRACRCVRLIQMKFKSNRTHAHIYMALLIVVEKHRIVLKRSWIVLNVLIQRYFYKLFSLQSNYLTIPLIIFNLYSAFLHQTIYKYIIYKIYDPYPLWSKILSLLLT